MEAMGNDLLGDDFGPSLGDQAWHESPESPQHESPLLSPDAGDSADNSKPNIPTQKRRRVTRACDECRRKKIKCDGKQPCTHCTVYSYECTYDQPSNRRRNAAPQYIEALEKQLKRANSILRLLLPEVDLNDPSLESKLQQGLYSRPSLRPPDPQANGTSGSQAVSDGQIDSQLESMVKATGQLDLDEQGNLEYHGHSSGLSFVRRMREQLGDVMGPEGQGTPFVKSRPMSQVFDSPRSTNDSPFESSSPGVELPPKEVALQLCDIAVNDAGAILRIVHYPTFLKQLHSLYDTPPASYGNEENVFLPLMYSAMALGTLFSKNDGTDLDKRGYESAIAEGFKYFRYSRQLMDIADCRDLRQVQAVVFMIMFLQSSAKLSTCYAYIGVALRSALRMGLHRSFTDSFNPIEAETRKRVFWVIQRMDCYVGALLGLPHSLGDDDIDQELPAAVDDEFITETGILLMPEGRISVMAGANAHTTLVQILAKIVRYVYPLKGSGPNVSGKPVKSYSVSYAKIVEIERDLKDWQDKLPMGLKPGGEQTTVIIRVQHLLRMAYAHAQMMLYRPFLHYVSQTCKSRIVDKRSYACAAACVSVSRNIIHIAVEMKKQGLLVGAYWFSMYTTFFAILSLVFYALENPENDASRDVLRVAKEGKDTLQQLTKRSMAADRCSATLAALFEQLPERISRTRQNSVSSKKRKTDPSPSNPVPLVEVTRASLEPPMNTQPRRASTFPDAAVTSVDRKPAYPSVLRPQIVDDIMYPYATESTAYEYGQQYTGAGDAVSTPSLSSGISHRQESSFPASPSVLLEQSFPLADLSAMMFPSEDPFAYPNQTAAPAQTYDDLIKHLGEDPAFPFPSTLEELRQQRQIRQNNFVPPSSTFVFDNSNRNGNDINGSQDSDVTLLGPMPMYLMQGNPSAPQQRAPQHNGYSYGNIGHFPIPPQPQTYGPSSASMNLDQLMGGEEWAGMHADHGMGNLGSSFTPTAISRSGAQPFQSKAPTRGMPNMSNTDAEGVSFDDLNPGVLGWNLDGY
ncbi:hypothetical protein EJ08DRAFT_647599 [Tothia fuscella]|uniref:Zn(2)-C6 fungal-type domain-containing protein n=1 Tax=Tothia fuscella TaxID=1048955 RepID=A0A9P4U1S4_9PEZI|nr:hypothetical protein EJ08DRAFT_647599 [Tothia fuscella]